MPSGEYDGLSRRVSELESQLRALRQVFDFSASGINIRTGGSFTVTASGSVQLMAGGSASLTAGSHLSLKSQATITVGAQSSLTISAIQAVSLTGHSLTAKLVGDFDVTAGRDTYIGTSKSLEIETGLETVVSTGKTFKLDASDAFEVETGSAEIALKKDGSVLIDGKDLVLKASGKIDARASGDVILKGSKILQN